MHIIIIQGSHQTVFEGYKTLLNQISTLKTSADPSSKHCMYSYSIVYSIPIVGGRRLQVAIYSFTKFKCKVNNTV